MESIPAPEAASHLPHDIRRIAACSAAGATKLVTNPVFGDLDLMKLFNRCCMSLCALAFAASAAHGQIYKLHNADIAFNATGQFTTPLTSTYTGVTQRTTDSFGGVISLREHPVSWAGIEFNYGFTDFHERFDAAKYYATVKTNMHEATAAYLIQPHFRKLQPFLAIGGGGIDFAPAQGQTQWRGTGLVEAGLDIPTSNPHFGFRVQGRSLIYRAPNFRQVNLGSKTWVATDEPSVGAWIRF